MRITIQAPISRKTVNERSAFTVTAKFYTDTADPWTLAAPTSAKYRIDSDTGYAIRDWTSLTPATSISIPISSSDNATLNDGRNWEQKTLTVKMDDGLSTQYQETYSWNVNNLSGQL